MAWQGLRGGVAKAALDGVAVSRYLPATCTSPADWEGVTATIAPVANVFCRKGIS